MQYGFTLIELLVSLAIIAILASLSIAGLSIARQRGKIDKTKSTIRKLHEIVMPQYEGFLSRRTRAATPINRLAAIRLLMVQEMPDQWGDVYPLSISGVTAPVYRYAQLKNALASATGTQWGVNRDKYGSAECLTMIVLRSGFQPDATEQFRTDELGDIDGDGAPEFWDGWSRPISFIRWPAGFSSPVQSRDASVNPDPFDPNRVSTAVAYPDPATPQKDYGLIPLIYSMGPSAASDDPLSPISGYAIDTTLSYTSRLPLLTTRLGTPMAGEISDAAAAADNITNHDLLKK